MEEKKRLNVAVSRARREMIVYSSLKASHIDLKRTKARGVEGLKHFLEYAEQQILIQAANAHKESSDRVISEQIANALRARGHNVNTNVDVLTLKSTWPLQILLPAAIILWVFYLMVRFTTIPKPQETARLFSQRY